MSTQGEPITFAAKTAPDRQRAAEAGWQNGRVRARQRGQQGRHRGKSAKPDKNSQAAGMGADVNRGEPRLLGDIGCDKEDCEDLQVSPAGKSVVWPTKADGLSLQPQGSLVHGSARTGHEEEWQTFPKAIRRPYDSNHGPGINLHVPKLNILSGFSEGNAHIGCSV
jgi:hypothetical protein